MGRKYKRFREFRTPFSLRDIRKNPRSMYARVPQSMAQFVLKIEKLSHIMGPTPILEMARAYGLRPRLWLLVTHRKASSNTSLCSEQKCQAKFIASLCSVLMYKFKNALMPGKITDKVSTLLSTCHGTVILVHVLRFSNIREGKNAYKSFTMV